MVVDIEKVFGNALVIDLCLQFIVLVYHVFREDEHQHLEACAQAKYQPHIGGFSKSHNGTMISFVGENVQEGEHTG